jgi:hypothetical protein
LVYLFLIIIIKKKLYPTKSALTNQSSRKPVVSEFYDEIVFVNPSVLLLFFSFHINYFKFLINLRIKKKKKKAEFYDLLKTVKYLQVDENLNKNN